MTAPSDLKELLARVEKATGADDLLDADISFALGWSSRNRDHYEWTEADGTFVQSFMPKPFTASLDASLALVERVLPGKAGVVSFGGMWSRADFINAEGVYLHATCRTPALALLAAVLKALIAKENDRG